MKTFPVLRKTTPLAKHFLTFYFPNLLIFNTFTVKIKCQSVIAARRERKSIAAQRDRVLKALHALFRCVPIQANHELKTED